MITRGCKILIKLQGLVHQLESNELRKATYEELQEMIEKLSNKVDPSE